MQLLIYLNIKKNIFCLFTIYAIIMVIYVLGQKEKLQKLYQERDNVLVDTFLIALTQCAKGGTQDNLLDLAIKVLLVVLR